MKRKTLAAILIEGRTTLEMNQQQMAKHMRIGVAAYEALESGAKVLPLQQREALRKRVNTLLEKCGLERVK